MDPLERQVLQLLTVVLFISVIDISSAQSFSEHDIDYGYESDPNGTNKNESEGSGARGTKVYRYPQISDILYGRSLTSNSL